MQKSAYLIHLLLAVYLVAGTAMTLTPRWVVEGKAHLLAMVKPAAVPTEHGNAVRRTRRSGMVLLALVAALVLGMHLSYGLRPAGGNGAGPAQASATELQRRVAGHLRPLVEGGRYPGLAAAGIAGDARFFVGLGSIRAGENRPPTEDTIFEIGSLTKLFTGLLAAREIERGALDLDQDVGSILTADAEDHATTRWPSLRALLTHTAGLPRLPPCASGPGLLWAGFSGGNPYAGCAAQKLLDDLPAPACDAGVNGASQACGFSYSNYGFALIGLALSRRAGTSYEALVGREITAPLGMHDTSVVLDADQRTRFAAGHANYVGLGPFYATQRAAPWTFPDALAGAGGLRSSAADMLRFLEASSGRIPSTLSPAIRLSQEILYREPAADGQDPTLGSGSPAAAVGMAWFEKRLPDSNHVILFHDGQTGGHAAYIALLRDAPFGVVVLANAASGLEDVGESLLGLLLEAPPLPGMPPNDKDVR